jgi:hypothetical protein
MIKSSQHDSRDLNCGRHVVQRGSVVRRLIAGVVLVMPIMAVAESHMGSGSATARLNATAHANFKIVIPSVLYLNVASEDNPIPGARTVMVMSTGRDITLNATVRAPTAGLPVSIGTAAAGNIVLTAAARKSIAQNVPCTRGDGPIVCTASMP